jgi:hypothetical protein
MATQRLPYEFVRWYPDWGSTEEILEKLSRAPEDRYFFLEVDIEPLAPEFQAKVSKYPSSREP